MHHKKALATKRDKVVELQKEISLRQAELDKINVMIIVGENEKEQETVSVRRRFLGDLGAMKLDELTDQLIDEINKRRDTNRKKT